MNTEDYRELIVESVDNWFDVYDIRVKQRGATPEMAKEAVLKLINHVRKEAGVDALNGLWQLVPAVTAWDSEESIRNSWLKSLIENQVKELEGGDK